LAALSGVARKNVFATQSSKVLTGLTVYVPSGCQFITGEIAGFGIEPVVYSLKPKKSVL